MDFMEFHRNGRFSRKNANFTENVTAVKSWNCELGWFLVMLPEIIVHYVIMLHCVPYRVVVLSYFTQLCLQVYS